jgi:hypothetical protein
MNNKESQWIDIIKSTKLTRDERDSMRRALTDFMTAHPIGTRRSFYVRIFSIFNTRIITFKRSVAIAVICALAAGGSVSYAAENALPGDPLYPVKIYVNEGTREALAFSGKAKTQLAVELANRRLEEAAKLAVKGGLTAQNEEHVNASAKNQIKDAQEKIAELKKKDASAAADASIDLNSVLSAHRIVLARAEDQKQKEHNESSVRSIQVLSSIVSAAENESKTEEDSGRITAAATIQSHAATPMNTATNSTAMTSPETQQAAQGKEKAARKKLADVAREVLRTSSSSETASTPAEVKFSQAQAMLVQGETMLAAGSYGDAFNAFQQTIQLAQEAKILANLQKEFTGEFHVDLSEDQNVEREYNGSTTPESNTRGDNEQKKKYYNDNTNTHATSATETKAKGGLRIKESENHAGDMEREDDGREPGDDNSEVNTRTRIRIDDDGSRINIGSTTTLPL